MQRRRASRGFQRLGTSEQILSMNFEVNNINEPPALEHAPTMGHSGKFSLHIPISRKPRSAAP